MSVQGEFNKALGTAAMAASLAKGASALEANEKKAKAQSEKTQKIEDRQTLEFLEQSQNKIEGQRKNIAALDEKLAGKEAEIGKLTKASRNRRSGKQAMQEAKAALDDALEQKKRLQADRLARYTLLKQREQMAATARKEFTYGEE